jgi:hypothetical protein
MKKITQFLVAFIFVLGGTLTTFAYDFAAGDGTVANPYQVATRADLAGLKDFIGETGVDKYFIQTADINLSGSNWGPIATSSSNPFRGNFNGNGYKISNITINSLAGTSATSVNYHGLFGVVGSGSTIENVSIDGGSITVTSDDTHVGRTYTGGVIGYVYGVLNGNIVIRNCRNSANIVNEARDNGYAGGIIGYANVSLPDLTITTSSNTGNVSGNGNRVGGIIGSAYTSGTAPATGGSILISNCYNNAQITTTRASGDAFIGGIIGTPFIDNVNTGPVTIDKCFATGTVSVTPTNSAARTGGISGRLNDRPEAISPVTISHSVAAQESLTSAGGTTRRIYPSHSTDGYFLVISNYAYSGMLINGAPITSANEDNSQGLDKTLAQLHVAATYAALGWDFTNTWTIEEGVSFPTLKQISPATGVQSPKVAASLTAFASKGALTLEGLVAGESVYVYTVQGTTVAKLIAKGEKQTINLPAPGIYIVSSGTKVAKVINN